LVACAVACACSGKPDVPILTWHAIGPAGALSGDDDEGWTVDAAAFSAQLDALQGAGYRTVPLTDAIDAQEKGISLPGKPVVLTFDDGTEDHYSRALPILKAHGMTGLFFVVSGNVRAEESERLVKSGRRQLLWREARQLVQDGMEIGSHSLTHARLPELDDRAAKLELEQSKAALEEHLGVPVKVFAFPYNSLRRRHRAMAKEAGYLAAVAGVVHGGRGRYALKRVPVKSETTPARLLELLRE
jgi:peptidoglycan/xylan/chitin deacetylase (PgdA/CDA1 family)